MELNKLKKIKGIKKSAKRRGRGIGSGKGGHTTGYGQKGQTSRKGNSIPTGFEGGQVPVYKKVPQIGGFRSSKKFHILGMALSLLNHFEANSEVTPELVVSNGILNTKRIKKFKVKLLGTGELDRALKLKGFLFTQTARQKVLDSKSEIVE